MPRLYLDDGDHTPLDFCSECWTYDHDGDSHPAYDDEEYYCEQCGRLLIGEDD